MLSFSFLLYENNNNNNRSFMLKSLPVGLAGIGGVIAGHDIYDRYFRPDSFDTIKSVYKFADKNSDLRNSNYPEFVSKIYDIANGGMVGKYPWIPGVIGATATAIPAAYLTGKLNKSTNK